MNNGQLIIDNGSLTVGEASVHYQSATVNSPLVPPGYKQTEVGVIPEDWNVKPLSACLCSRPDYGINAPAVPYSDKLPVYIRITDITEDGLFCPDKLVSVDSTESNNYYLSDGDIVFARTGASVGKSYLYRSDDGPLVFAGFLIRVRPDQCILSPTFLAAYISTGIYWNWVRLMSMRSGQPGINGNEYAQLPVPIPTIPEQRAIAAALLDVDALLAKLDQLIAKKRDLKQAAMQQLLTGQTRLPRFSGEWEVKQLGEVAAFYKGKGLAKSELNPYGSEPCIHYGELFTKYPESISKILSRTNATAGVFRSIANDVLMPTSDVTPNGLATASCIHQDKVVLGGDILVIRADPNILEGSFISYVIRRLRDQVMQLVTGTTVFHLYGSDMKKFTFSMPQVKEQHAIVKILDDMDAEIAALEARRNKTKDLKQGMMQELLTGRIRLV